MISGPLSYWVFREAAPPGHCSVHTKSSSFLLWKNAVRQVNLSTQVGAPTLKYTSIFFMLSSNFLLSKRLRFLVIIALQRRTCADQLLSAVLVVHSGTCWPEFCSSLQPRLTKQNKKARSINSYFDS